MTAIGYAKLGKSLQLNPGDPGFQGNQEAPHLLLHLAERNRDVKWVIVGRNQGTYDFGPNVANIWEGAAEKAKSMPPYDYGPPWYQSQWPVKWAGPPHITMSEQSSFEDAVVQTICGLNGMVIHAGQHGTSNISIPNADWTWERALANPAQGMTNPQDWSKSYARFLIRGLNALGDRTHGQAPVVWIVTDPRNYVKARDIKWHTGLDDILSQYELSRHQKHERFRDPRSPEEFGVAGAKWDRDGELWILKHTYRHGGLELMILPDDWSSWGPASWADRQPAGVATTSQAATKGSERRRSQLVRDFLLQCWPTAEVFGRWDAKSLADVPANTVIQNDPTEFPQLLNRWRCTVALPVVGSGWTVAKPYQCFAANTVCFILGNADDQGYVLPSRRPVKGTKQVGEVDGIKLYSVRDDWTQPDLVLARWLRIETVREFKELSSQVVYDEGVWWSLVRAQRELLQRRWDESFLESEIERKLGIK